MSTAGLDAHLDPDQRADRLDRLERALCDSAVEHLVEMVLRRQGPDGYRAAAVDGSVEFVRELDAEGRPTYRITKVEGRDPLEHGALDHLVGHESERAAAFPHRTVNAYPHAHDSIAQFFDAPHSPDLVVTHTAAHHFDDHLGQHGSLGVVQARAPFIAAGAGVRADGIVERSTRTVHVAPTIAAVLGVEPHPAATGPGGAARADALLRRQDGDVETEVLTGETAEHVVVFLLDGTNANLLFDAIAVGEAPHIAGLVDRGTAYRHGMFASLPTATLANHTTAVTGAHPGHSGILHNTWFDRSNELTPDLLSMGEMFDAMVHLSPEVETVFQAARRSRPDAWCSATFEFCDTGAHLSSFGDFRTGGLPDIPDFATITHVDRDMAAASAQYRFMSTIDHHSATQTIEAWDRTAGNPLPTISWCSLALTDEAAHESGPHGAAARAAIRDSDARVGDVLRAVERAGALERTAVFVIADHGMEQNDPSVTGTWTEVLQDTGIPHLDVGQGLIYLRPYPRCVSQDAPDPARSTTQNG